MPDRRETMGGFHARQKVDYDTFFVIPDYTGNDNGEVKIPAHNIVCPTCRGNGTMVNPSIDSHGITQSEMEELGDEFREDYFAGAYDVTCSECKGKRVVLDALREELTPFQTKVLQAWEDAVAEEGQEIHYHNMGYQF